MRDALYTASRWFRYALKVENHLLAYMHEGAIPHRYRLIA